MAEGKHGKWLSASGRYGVLPSKKSPGAFDIVEMASGIILSTWVTRGAAKERARNHKAADRRRAAISRATVTP